MLILDGKYNSKMNFGFKQSFDTFCNLVERLISKQIAINIILEISRIIDAKFDENILFSRFNHETYKLPKCNQYCVALNKPDVSSDAQLSLGLYGEAAYKIKITNATKN